jgi:hypothetical protein
MVSFHIPLKGGTWFAMQFKKRRAAFAGSRHGALAEQDCNALAEAFGRQGFSLLTGCASGIDACFRKAFSLSKYRRRAFVACAFTERANEQQALGLRAHLVVKEHIKPKAALRQRTIWLSKKASLLVLFPDNPYTRAWGPGSSLAFWSCLYRNKPVFVVSSHYPKKDIHYLALPSNLFGVVGGYWAIPQLKGGIAL